MFREGPLYDRAHFRLGKSFRISSLRRHRVKVQSGYRPDLWAAKDEKDREEQGKMRFGLTFVWVCASKRLPDPN